MSAVELSPADEKPHKLPPITDEVVALTDTAEWQLMLGEDLEVCARDVDLLCINLRYRMSQIRIAYRLDRPTGLETPALLPPGHRGALDG